MTLYTKMTINSQRYPLNLYLINNVEDILLYFRVWKCSSNLIISKCFHLASHFYRETTTEINQFSKLYTLIYIIHTWSDKAFKDTVVNQTLSSLHGSGHLKLGLQSFLFKYYCRFIVWTFNWVRRYNLENILAGTGLPTKNETILRNSSSF